MTRTKPYDQEKVTKMEYALRGFILVIFVGLLWGGAILMGALADGCHC